MKTFEQIRELFSAQIILELDESKIVIIDSKLFHEPVICSRDLNFVASLTRIKAFGTWTNAETDIEVHLSNEVRENFFRICLDNGFIDCYLLRYFS